MGAAAPKRLPTVAGGSSPGAWEVGGSADCREWKILTRFICIEGDCQRQGKRLPVGWDHDDLRKLITQQTGERDCPGA